MFDKNKFSLLESAEIGLILTMSNSLQFSFHEHELETTVNSLKPTKLDTEGTQNT